MSVEVVNLTRMYGQQAVVNGISFKAEKGEILGFLGPNGAGKSTTMKIATCYIPPTSGTVSVAGYDVASSPQDVKMAVGYLPEHNPLYLDMYVWEYLSFIGSLHRLKGGYLTTRLATMIELCGLGPEQKKKIGALSKGYRQRVGLAQALIHDPKVLILDEPTTGLDPNQILEIRSLIREIGKEKTVIFSTHIMQEVQAICGKVVIINRGKIVADSKVEVLKKLHAGEKILHLEFETEVDVEALQGIEGVVEVIASGKCKYELIVLEGKDIRNEVFKMAGERQWPLLGLKQEEATLESIFKTLTDTQEE